MQKRIVKNNNRVNYAKLVDLLNSYIKIQKVKGKNIIDIINGIKENIDNEVIRKQEDYNKHLNTKTISLLENLVPTNVTPNQILMLIERFLEYRTDTSDFRRIQNVFTLIEYWKDPHKVSTFGTNWKNIMGKTK